jgi:ATP-dependent DNA helicase DinG
VNDSRSIPHADDAGAAGAIAHETASPLVAAVARAFEDAGALARGLNGYEPRPGQRAMAAAVAAVIDAGGSLLTEAGTGTGKTLAYLIPAILSRQRVLVSTGTKNLQEQIFFKDIPALRRALGLEFSATLMKGRGNYLCLHRWDLFRDGVIGGTSAAGRLIESGDRLLVSVIDDWLKTTPDGDRAGLRDLPEDVAMWRDLGADADTCLGSECPRYGECFVTLMRQRAAESDVVIVNHHLLCADAAIRQGEYGEVIPAAPTLVLDEAHQLEDVATQYFGYACSNLRIEELATDASRAVASAAFSVAAEAGDALMRLTDNARAFWSRLSTHSAPTGAASESRIRYTEESFVELFESGAQVTSDLNELADLFNRIARPSTAGSADEGTPMPGGEIDETAASVARRAGALRDHLRFLIRASDSSYVYFLERRGRAVLLRAAPIDVSRVVQSSILDRFRSVVLTSATLTVERSFAYIKARLGIREAQEIRVESEFDYPSQALLYLPRRMPAPKHPQFAQAAAQEAIEILRRSRGRAFLLFTSYAVLREVQRFVEMALPYPILVQGNAPRSVLIEEFRQTPNAVLLGTASFWQGVDVVGEALSCVVIDKLPFASPGDPITAARIDALREAGADAFADYQVPLAILTLQQGLGRLIRHRNDRGVLAILDPRLRTMGYGRRFLDSLPPAPVTHDLAAVERFFK